MRARRGVGAASGMGGAGGSGGAGCWEGVEDDAGDVPDAPEVEERGVRLRDWDEDVIGIGWEGCCAYVEDVGVGRVVNAV